MKDVKVRKPKFPKNCGIGSIYERFTNKWYKWRNLLPNNGDLIKITWLPNPKNNPTCSNTYIGMQGFVSDMNKEDGTFALKCEGCILIVLAGSFNYKKI